MAVFLVAYLQSLLIMWWWWWIGSGWETSHHNFLLHNFDVPLPTLSEYSITPQLARVLYPLHRVTFRGREFFVTGHEEDYSNRFMNKGVFYEISLAQGILRYHRQLGGNILEIGMNIGSICIPVASFCQGCKVIGIEATPTSFHKAVANRKLNGLLNLRTLNVALQDEENVTSLIIQNSPGNMSGSRMVVGNITNEENFRIEATTLDKLRPELQNIRIAKVGIEGAEKVLKGGMQWLGENPPCVIIMEIDRIKSHAMVHLLESKGFTAFDASQEGIRTSSPNIVFKHEDQGCLTNEVELISEHSESNSQKYVVVMPSVRRNNDTYLVNALESLEVAKPPNVKVLLVNANIPTEDHTYLVEWCASHHEYICVEPPIVPQSLIEEVIANDKRRDTPNYLKWRTMESLHALFGMQEFLKTGAKYMVWLQDDVTVEGDIFTSLPDAEKVCLRVKGYCGMVAYMFGKSYVNRLVVEIERHFKSMPIDWIVDRTKVDKNGTKAEHTVRILKAYHHGRVSSNEKTRETDKE